MSEHPRHPAHKSAPHEPEQGAGPVPDSVSDTLPEFLTEERRKSIKKVLLEERSKILVEAKNEIANFIRGDDKQLVDAALDDGDWSVVDLSEDIALQKLQHHKFKLDKIDEALQKLRDGTYGVCEDCGGSISEGRLRVLPYAVYCVECKERREKLEEIEKENSF